MVVGQLLITPTVEICILQLGRVEMVFSKRQRITLRLLYATSRPSVVCLSVCLSVVCRLSVSLSVCDVGAPYSGG